MDFSDVLREHMIVLALCNVSALDVDTLLTFGRNIKLTGTAVVLLWCLTTAQPAEKKAVLGCLSLEMSNVKES